MDARWTARSWMLAAIVVGIGLVGPREHASAELTWSAPQAVNTNAATDGGDDDDGSPSIAIDRSGVAVTVWQHDFDGDAYEIRMARSTDRGATWSDPTAISGNFVAVESPDVATNGTGTWVIVFGVERQAAAGARPSDDIYAVRSSDGGRTWSAPALLADVADDLGPEIATNGKGAWVVVWGASADSFSPSSVWFARSIDEGLTWSTPTRIETEPASTSEAYPADVFAHGSTDTWIIGADTADDTVAVSRSVDGGASWSPLRRISTTETAGQSVTLGHDAGAWLAAWQGTGDSETSVFVARSVDGGATWAPFSVVAQSEDGEGYAPSIAGSGGRWVMTWADWGAIGERSFPDVAFSESGDGGATWTPFAILNADAANPDRGGSSAVVTDGAGTWVAVWESWNATGRVIAEGFGDDFDILFARATSLSRSCGDVDGNGSVSVTDGVQTLRAAAGLASCEISICDVDGNGVVSVTDGVNVLRQAAGLPGNLQCLRP